jgi:hypothetical protein
MIRLKLYRIAGGKTRTRFVQGPAFTKNVLRMTGQKEMA